MGAIARSAANLITTSGVVLKGAVNNDSFDNVTALPSSFGDGITLISSQTASASASLSFTTGIDSTYKAYKFVFSNIHPANNDAQFRFGLSSDGGSSYNVTKTTTYFRAQHTEAGTGGDLTYDVNADLAQSTGTQVLGFNLGNGNDESLSGFFTLFNPSSTTYVKHFMGTFTLYDDGDLTRTGYVAGYGNTTSAVNAIQFVMNAGNIDAGTIYLYGIK
jgi:hypothetical protein